MDQNPIPTEGPGQPPPRPERPWQEEQQALSDINQKINRLGGSRSPAPARSGGGSGRWAGIPVVLAICFGARVLFGLMGTSHSTNYTPSPTLPPNYAPVKPNDQDLQRRLDEINRNGRQQDDPNLDLWINDHLLDVRKPETKTTEPAPKPLPRKDPVGPPAPNNQ